MLKEIGISGGTAVAILLALYFVIKWGVKNGIRDYFAEKPQTEAMKAQWTEAHQKTDE